MRTDFNEDFEKIDTALNTAQTVADGAASVADTKARVVVGGYGGNGASSRSFNLGGKPLAVLVERRDGTRNESFTYAGMALQDTPCRTSLSQDAIVINSTGFSVYKASYAMANDSGQLYSYVAIF